MGQFHFLKIEIDGHLHGAQAPRPWVAQITGTSPRYGLARDFIDPMNDWKEAHKAWSGNVYGVVSTFPLRDGNLYEVCRLRGRGRRRGPVREFRAVEGGKLVALEPLEALARAEGHDDPTVTLRVPETHDPPFPRVSEVRGLGIPDRKGFVVVDHVRLYRLRVGMLYEVIEGESRRLLLAELGGPVELVERAALEHLLRAA